MNNSNGRPRVILDANLMNNLKFNQTNQEIYRDVQRFSYRSVFVDDYQQCIYGSLKRDYFREAQTPFEHRAQTQKAHDSLNSLHAHQSNAIFLEPLPLIKPLTRYQKKESKEEKRKRPKKGSANRKRPEVKSVFDSSDQKQTKSKTQINLPAVNVMIKVEQEIVDPMEVLARIDRNRKTFRMGNEDINRLNLLAEMDREAKQLFFHPRSLSFVPMK